MCQPSSWRLQSGWHAEAARRDKEERELSSRVAIATVRGRVSTWSRRFCWRSNQAQRQGHKKGQEERRKKHCIRWGRRATSADIMTKFLLGGPVSVGRIVRCPADTLQLLCADGCDCVNVRDPIPLVSIPESLLGGRRRGGSCSLS